MIESGAMDLYWRASDMVPYCLRLTNPRVILEFLNVEDFVAITLEDTKGILVVLAVGCGVAFIVFYVQLFKNFFKN